MSAATQSARVSRNADGAARIWDGALLRGGSRIGGFGLVVSEPGIWIVNGASVTPDMLLLKPGVSLVMLMAGFCCATLGRAG